MLGSPRRTVTPGHTAGTAAGARGYKVEPFDGWNRGDRQVALYGHWNQILRPGAGTNINGCCAVRPDGHTVTALRSRADRIVLGG